VNLQRIKRLTQLTLDELEERISMLENLYSQAPADSQPDLIDEIGDYLKAYDLRTQVDAGVDFNRALRDLARRMRSFGRVISSPYSEWLSKAASEPTPENAKIEQYPD
jgi:NADPH:quinone reductase-like Zn-dependent oxidoreductase